MVRNPFSDTKLEYETEPVLWFSQRSRKIADRGKSTFVSGTRGSGKTSILKSLSTIDIANISSLNQQLSNRRLEWFGVYIRLQDAFADVLTGRPEEKGDIAVRKSRKNQNFAIFAQYVELLLLSALCEDLASLRATRFLKFSAGSEYDAIQRLFSECDALAQYAQGRHIETLLDLARVCRQILDSLFSAAIDAESRSPIGKYRASVPGDILRLSAKFILPIIRGDRFKQGQKLRFKVMIDDCEVLPLEHQVYLNTLIRNTSQPISWVIAYVGSLYDSRATIRPNQMLSDADREIEQLDETKEAEFKQLCTRIASLRLYQSLSPAARASAGLTNPNECFKLSERLGRFSLNYLVERSLDRSLSEGAVRWRERALAWQELFRMADLGRETSDQFEIRDGSLPYTVAVAAEYLDIDLETASRQLIVDRSRKILERRLARKQRAAFLVLGRETGTRMLLAGEGIVIALSDSCIRDFLDFMREIFEREVGEASEGALVRFIKSENPISITTQSAAIYAASEAKVRGVMTIADPYGVGVTRLIEALGRLTAEMQSGEGAIRNPELGLFRLNWPRMRSLLITLGLPAVELEELFRKSELDGFVREVDEFDRVLSRPDPRLTETRLFRLHRRFAPAFGFSFRGPYGVFALPESAFAEVLVADSSFDMANWVRRVARRVEPQEQSEGQLSLPGMGDEDE